MTFLEVFAGAVLGGMGRLFLARRLPPLWGTFTANMLACALLGWAPSSLILGAGLAGALSTWSTLAKEVGSLPPRRGLPYLAATVACGAALIFATSTYF